MNGISKSNYFILKLNFSKVENYFINFLDDKTLWSFINTKNYKQKN